MSPTKKTHFVAIPVNVMVAGYAKYSVFVNAGRANQGIEKTCDQFVFIGLPRESQIASHENKIGGNSVASLSPNIIAHSFQDHVLRPGCGYTHVDIRNVKPANRTERMLGHRIVPLPEHNTATEMDQRLDRSLNLRRLYVIGFADLNPFPKLRHAAAFRHKSYR